MTDQLENEAQAERAIYAPISETPTSYVREPEGAHPQLDTRGYKSTRLRHPKHPLIYLPQTITEVTGPQLTADRIVGGYDNDLTRQHKGEPIGERITLTG